MKENGKEGSNNVLQTSRQERTVSTNTGLVNVERAEMK